MGFMKRDFPDRPIAAVGAVIVHDGRVLLILRGKEPRKGQWSIPGGAVEAGETLRQCAAREAREETGLEVEPGGILEVIDSIHHAADGRVHYHYVLIDFLCRVVGGELRAGGDAIEARWTRESELVSLQVDNAAVRVIRKALGGIA
jgi:ADP-ribose pyrophosphatase YjhB (NUDIX family)